MLYSKQKWFCNNCGTEKNTQMSSGHDGTVGREWKVCSIECHHEIEWKRVLSIMGKEYYPKQESADKILVKVMK